FAMTMPSMVLDEDAKADSKGGDEEGGGRGDKEDGKSLGSASSTQRRCTLTCCAPDGSPLQGKAFVIGPEGATLGRKATNQIALYMKVMDTQTGEERIANVDTAISSEHARVIYDDSTSCFFISDGTSGKPSTNGTWFRLSGPHQESPPHLIEGGAEILVGTVRFVVKESMTISERKLEDGVGEK
ncbi:FHA domain-containing protein, partial [archaeon]